MSGKRRYHPGEICPESGVYLLVHHKDVSHKQEDIPLSKGERFPPCRHCEHPIEWVLLSEA